MQTENQDNKDKKKNRPIPLIFWLGGALVTGGLITFAILNHKKGNEINNLTQKLSETEKTLTLEKAGLSEKLEKTTAGYNSLASEHEAALASLNEANARNNRLAASNTSYVKRENALKDEISLLKDSTNRLLSYNMALQAEADKLRSDVSNRDSRINSGEQLTAEQAAEIQRQIELRRADSLAMVMLKDSIARENVSGYFNNTDLTGAVGLQIRDADYTKYFFGFTTVNGYVINKHFMAGVGVGLSAYNGGLMAPLFLDMRYTFAKRSFRPYIFADGGILINFDNLKQPSLFVNPGFGIEKAIGRKFSVNFGAGYFLQRDDKRNSFINAKLGLIYRKK